MTASFGDSLDDLLLQFLHDEAVDIAGELDYLQDWFQGQQASTPTIIVRVVFFFRIGEDHRLGWRLLEEDSDLRDNVEMGHTLHAPWYSSEYTHGDNNKHGQVVISSLKGHHFRGGAVKGGARGTLAPPW